MTKNIIQELYDSEINCIVSTFWDGGFTWRLGDHMNTFVACGIAETFAEAESKLAKAAALAYPDSDFVKSRMQPA